MSALLVLEDGRTFEGESYGATGETFGEAVFNTRCKACHDPAIERAPNRSSLASMPASYIVQALTSGVMAPMAAGLSVRPDAIPELREFLCERLAAETEAASAADGLEIDAVVTTGGCDRALWQDFQRLAPFGPGNPEPLFAAADVRIERPMALKGGHVRCTLVDGSGGKLKAVAWRSDETELGRRLLVEGGAIHVVGRLKPDDWQGREGVEFEIEDAADPRRA